MSYFVLQLPVSSIVESSGRFLVSRMTELALAASHSEVCITIVLCLYVPYNSKFSWLNIFVIFVDYTVTKISLQHP